MFYLIIYVILSFLSVYYFSGKHAHYKFVRGILFILLVYIAGMRYNLGPDYFTYWNRFLETPTIIDMMYYPKMTTRFMQDQGAWAPGFLILEVIVRSFTDNPQWLFLTASLICTILLFKALTYFTNRQTFILALLTYFCSLYLLMEMQALRQALAAGFIYMSYMQLSRKNYVWMAIHFLLALSFHVSAILVAPFMLIIGRRIPAFVQFGLLLLAMASFIFEFSWLKATVLYVAQFTKGAAVEHAITYATNDLHSFKRTFFVTFFLYLAVYVYFVWKFRKNKYYSPERPLIIGQNLLWCFLIITSYFWEINYFSVRIAWYFLIGLAICMGKMPQLCSRQRRVPTFLFALAFNFLLVRPFVFPTMTTAPFSPYEDYISCEVFGMESTGKERTRKYQDEFYRLMQ